MLGRGLIRPGSGRRKINRDSVSRLVRRRPAGQYLSPYHSTGLPWEKPPPGYPTPYLGRGLPSDWRLPPSHPTQEPIPPHPGYHDSHRRIALLLAAMFDCGRWSSYHRVCLHLIVNKLLFLMQALVAEDVGHSAIWPGIFKMVFFVSWDLETTSWRTPQTDRSKTFPWAPGSTNRGWVPLASWPNVTYLRSVWQKYLAMSRKLFCSDH